MRMDNGKRNEKEEKKALNWKPKWMLLHSETFIFKNQNSHHFIFPILVQRLSKWYATLLLLFVLGLQAYTACLISYSWNSFELALIELRDIYLHSLKISFKWSAKEYVRLNTVILFSVTQ